MFLKEMFLKIVAVMFCGWILVCLSSDRAQAQTQAETEENTENAYVAPSSPPLYEESPGPRQEKNYFSFTGQFLAGRAIPLHESRDPGPGQLLGAKVTYNMGTPMMSELGLGFEFYGGRLHYSTGDLRLVGALAIHLSYKTDISGQFKLGSQGSFGQSYGHYRETIDDIPVTSGNFLVQGNYGRFEVGAFLSPFNNIELSAGGGYGYFTYSIQRIQKDEFPLNHTDGSSSSEDSSHPLPSLPSQQLRFHFPFVFIATSLQL